MKLPKIFCQRDKAWAAIKIGYSVITIGGYGCLISCYAMVLRFWGRKTDPAMLNRLLTKNGGFTKDGLMLMNKVAEIYEYKQSIVDTQKRTMSEAELKFLLDTIRGGVPVIIQVDMIPKSSKADMHFCVGFEVTEDGKDIMIADPWTGRLVSLLATYGLKSWTLKRAVYRYIILKKP